MADFRKLLTQAAARADKAPDAKQMDKNFAALITAAIKRHQERPKAVESDKLFRVDFFGNIRVASYPALGRALFPIQELPQVGLPIYDLDLSPAAVVVGEAEDSPQ